MEDILMEQFYALMKEETNYKTALSITYMLNDLSQYRRDIIYNEYVNNHKPFEKIDKWDENVTFFTYFQGIPNISESIASDIISEKSGTTLRLFDLKQLKEKQPIDLVGIILDTIGLNDFYRKGNFYCKKFSFPDEEETFYKYLDNLLYKLEEEKKRIIEKINKK